MNKQLQIKAVVVIIDENFVDTDVFGCLTIGLIFGDEDRSSEFAGDEFCDKVAQS